jgi:tyrosyl-tRNA synthetase
MKADGGKFGKTEAGNVWLDPLKTSPYKFYQFWLNASDEDAEKYIKIFTVFTQEEIERMISEHHASPHLRILQKALAKDVTIRVHSEEEYKTAVDASSILFGAGTTEMLRNLPEELLLSVFEGVPQSNVSRHELEKGISVVDFLAEKTAIFPSKSEARRMLKENGVAINKQKVMESYVIKENDLLNNKYILVQKGKKNYYLVKSN